MPTAPATTNSPTGWPYRPAPVTISGQLQVLADDLVEDYVEHCRMHEVSWTDIGSLPGVTRQAVQQRFQAPHQRYTETMTEDLWRAMVHVKAEVVHRSVGVR